MMTSEAAITYVLEQIKELENELNKYYRILETCDPDEVNLIKFKLNMKVF